MARLGTNTKQTGESRGSHKAPHECCHELCAIATTGTLTDAELGQLKSHLAQWKECVELFRKYREVARTAMPLLMTEESVGDPKAQEPWTPEVARSELFSRIAKGEQVGWSSDATIRGQRAERRSAWSVWTRLQISSWQAGLRFALPIAALAIVIASVYRFGFTREQGLARPRVTTAAMEKTFLG